MICYRPEDAGKLMSVSRRQIYKWVGTGELRGSYLDAKRKRMLRITQADIEAFLASRPRTNLRTNPDQ